MDQVLKTGNVMADAILNSKLSLAGARKIAVNAKARVPEHMAVSDVNLCSILGNLMDNAIAVSYTHLLAIRRLFLLVFMKAFIIIV